MESYPDPTLPSRPPSYPYFLDSVGTPESHDFHQNHNFTPPQPSGQSHTQLGDLGDDVVPAETSKYPLGVSEHPLAVFRHPFRTSVGTATTYNMPPPALPVPRKRRRRGPREEQDAPPKRQRLPVVGVFRPPQPPIRSPLRTIKNAQNANFTAKNQETELATLAKHKNTRESTKSTIVYKEDRQGKLVIQKYHPRSGSVVTARYKRENSYQLPSASQNQGQRLIKSLAFPATPPSRAPFNQELTPPNYLHNLYRAFKQDFEDTSLPRTNHLAETINPQDLDLTMEGSDNHQNQRVEEYYFDGPAPPPSAPPPTQNNVTQQRAPEPQSGPGMKYVAARDIITPGEQRGLATRANYNPDKPSVLRKSTAGKGNGHGVREFVELMNHERRDVAPSHRESSMTSPRFADPPLAGIDTITDETRALSAFLGASSASSGAFAPSPGASDEGVVGEMHNSNATRPPSPLFSHEQAGNNNQNPFAFASGEHLAHPNLSPPQWDGRDLTGFPIHLPDHSPEAQQALSDAYNLQPWYDPVVVGSWGCGFGEYQVLLGMRGGCWAKEKLEQWVGEEYEEYEEEGHQGDE